VQSAFLRVFERIEQFEVGRPFEPWFIRIIINDALMLEKRKRNVPFDLAFESEQLPIASQEPAVDDMLIANETTEAIWEAIGRLSARQRAVIVMRYYLGMDEDEMATELDCAPGTVKSRLHAARQRLRELLPASE
jgi:RNA polymerase sigma-70 factor (ECF subfamily)